ncbi:MAG: Jag N-terminal domain-containing protein [Deltaproteobacteria bacterium]|nr:Jag N-terminal domain-containing protein [Deltaproteobacteria bacterium]
MESEYEFEGKTKEEAVRKACEKLGLPEDQLEIDVISYGSTGIFGLVGVKKARIKVVVPQEAHVEIEEPSRAQEHVEERSRAEEYVEEPSRAEEHVDVAEVARNTLEKIVSFIVEDATVTVEANAERMKLTVEGGNSAILIGKHGRTLDALQYIVQKVVHKEKKTRMRISVDVEGYRDRRKTSLTQLALRLGEKVKRSGKPATINPMNAYDRRIVHVALKDETEIRTQSMGTGLLRKLVIYPQRKQRQRPSA